MYLEFSGQKVVNWKPRWLVHVHRNDVDLLRRRCDVAIRSDERLNDVLLRLLLLLLLRHLSLLRIRHGSSLLLLLLLLMLLL